MKSFFFILVSFLSVALFAQENPVNKTNPQQAAAVSTPLESNIEIKTTPVESNYKFGLGSTFLLFNPTLDKMNDIKNKGDYLFRVQLSPRFEIKNIDFLSNKTSIVLSSVLRLNNSFSFANPDAKVRTYNSTFLNQTFRISWNGHKLGDFGTLNLSLLELTPRLIAPFKATHTISATQFRFDYTSPVYAGASIALAYYEAFYHNDADYEEKLNDEKRMARFGLLTRNDYFSLALNYQVTQNLTSIFSAAYSIDSKSNKDKSVHTVTPTFELDYSMNNYGTLIFSLSGDLPTDKKLNPFVSTFTTALGYSYTIL